jgi:hypothetical protein
MDFVHAKGVTGTPEFCESQVHNVPFFFSHWNTAIDFPGLPVCGNHQNGSDPFIAVFSQNTPRSNGLVIGMSMDNHEYGGLAAVAGPIPDRVLFVSLVIAICVQDGETSLNTAERGIGKSRHVP